MKRAESVTLNQRLLSRFPTPTVVLVELTNACNEACVHCIRDCNGLAPAHDWMTTENWLNVIDDTSRLNGMAISFTGGEAMIHPDFFLLVERVRSHRMAVSVKTNGLMLEQYATRLRETGVKYLEVSLHGGTAQVHDRITRVPGSFDRCIAGVKAARALGISVMLKCNLFRWNVAEIGRVRAIAKELNCGINRDFFLINSDYGRTFDDDFVTPEQVRDIEAVWPQATMVANQNREHKPMKCTQGLNSCAVSADGVILSCILVRKPLGHIRDAGLYETWQRHAGHAHEINYQRFDRCSGCALMPKCHVCVGQNYSATGSLYDPPIERCYVTMSLYGKEIFESSTSGRSAA